MRKDDPCTGVCQWDGRTGWCLGCGRTVPEIRAWRKMTPYRKTALARELPRRVRQIAVTHAEADPAKDRADARWPVPATPAAVTVWRRVRAMRTSTQVHLSRLCSGRPGQDRRLLRLLGVAAPRQVPWWLIPGMASLALFAYLLTFVETEAAGRAYAAYGGI